MAKTVNEVCLAAVKRKIAKYTKQVTMVYKAVVKVFKAKASANRWTDTGIVGAAVLLIDRYLKGAAIIRVYDLESKFQLRFEQEIYYNMEFKATAVPTFYTFEVKGAAIGFSFADTTEAKTFASKVNSVKPKFVTPPPTKPARQSFFGKLGNRVKNVLGATSPKAEAPQIKITGRAVDYQHMFSVNLSGVTDPNDIKNMTPELKDLFKSQGITKKTLRQNPEMTKKILETYKTGGVEALEQELGVNSQPSEARKSRKEKKKKKARQSRRGPPPPPPGRESVPDDEAGQTSPKKAPAKPPPPTPPPVPRAKAIKKKKSAKQRSPAMPPPKPKKKPPAKPSAPPAPKKPSRSPAKAAPKPAPKKRTPKPAPKSDTSGSDSDAEDTKQAPPVPPPVPAMRTPPPVPGVPKAPPPPPAANKPSASSPPIPPAPRVPGNPPGVPPAPPVPSNPPGLPPAPGGPPPPPAAAAPAGGRGGLLAAIRLGKSLKKAKPVKKGGKNSKKKESGAAASGGEGISDLFNILKEKRKKIDGDSSSDGNDSDWTTDEDFDDDF